MSLKVLVTGTGKDGTNSICELIRSAATLNGDTYRVAHEPDVFRILHAQTRFLETGDRRWRDEIAAIVRGWDLDVAVSGGVSFCLDVFREQFGPGLKVIHLRREREAYLRSVMNAVLANPDTHGYYLDSPGPFSLHRPAAFHYGDMSRDEWAALPVEARFGWSFDKQHQLFDETRAAFDGTLLVRTETLSDPAVIQQIVHFINSAWTTCPPPVYRNAMRIVDHRDFTLAQRKRLHGLFVGFDVERAMESSFYPVNYFLSFADVAAASAAGDQELRRFLDFADRIRDQVAAKR